MIRVNSVVQFNEIHKWCGCLGIVDEIKEDRLMVGIPMPEKGTAYIFCNESEIEYIGEASLIQR